MNIGYAESQIGSRRHHCREFATMGRHTHSRVIDDNHLLYVCSVIGMEEGHTRSLICFRNACRRLRRAGRSGAVGAVTARGGVRSPRGRRLAPGIATASRRWRLSFAQRSEGQKGSRMDVARQAVTAYLEVQKSGREDQLVGGVPNQALRARRGDRALSERLSHEAAHIGVTPDEVVVARVHQQILDDLIAIGRVSAGRPRSPPGAAKACPAGCRFRGSAALSPHA